MIKSVTITNYIGDSLKLELSDPWETGVAIQDITGLGPVKANMNFTKLVTSDGGLFNSARLNNRNIVFKFRVFGGRSCSVEDSRMTLYNLFIVKKQVRLIFETDNRHVYIDGYVESNQPVIFSNKETLQVSVICPDPFFKSMTPLHMQFHGNEPAFEFEFSNESLTEPLLTMSEIKNAAYRNIYYDGDEETGMKITLDLTGDIKDFTIYNIDTNEKMKLNDASLEHIIGTRFIAGDTIILSTINKKKGLKLIRGSKEYNILNILDKNVDWLKLRKGNNTFAYVVSEGNEYVHISIDNDILYTGI